MAAHKGHKKAGGRQKGTPNKLNADIKSMIVTALSEVGGVKYLERQANENPVAFMGLVGKVLPMQVTGADGGPVQTRLEVTFIVPGPTHLIT